MSTDRDLLPLNERQAARAAIEVLVQREGSQAAAAEKFGVSQNAVNKAVLYTRVGPSVMRLLLAHLEMDLPQLLRRYGDPANAPPDAPAPRAATAREQAIVTAIQFAPGASEREVREIAAGYDQLLANAPAIEWLETLVREVQRQILAPGRQQRGSERRARSDQRALRKLHDAAHPEPVAEVAPAKTARRTPAR